MELVLQRGTFTFFSSSLGGAGGVGVVSEVGVVSGWGSEVVGVGVAPDDRWNRLPRKLRRLPGSGGGVAEIKSEIKQQRGP